jgi:hypothetical protein
VQSPSSRRSEEFLDRRLKLGDGPDAWRKLQRPILRPGDEVGSSGKGGLGSGRTVFDWYCQVCQSSGLWQGLGYEHDTQSVPRLPLSG